MLLIIEIFIFLSTVLPVFHLLNSFLTRKKQLMCTACEEKSFSIIIPCYNEEDTVQVSVHGLLAMDYQRYEAIYINDGSADNTLRVLDEILDLEEIEMATVPAGVKKVYQSHKYRKFFVIDKRNGGKSDALNTGIHFAKANLVVTLDADSVLKKDSLIHMNSAFEDEDIVAVGGSIHILQGYEPAYLQNRIGRKQSLLITLQILEYLKGFYIYKMSLSKQRATAIISGAFGVFQKEILLLAGGFRKSLGEDIDITMRTTVNPSNRTKNTVFT